MALRIEKSFVVDAPIDRVWAFLTDPRRVASCLPGAAVTEQIDDRTWGGTMTVKVGPVTASYRGKMKFERLDESAHAADIVASAQETRGKGAADMRMSSRVTERGDGQTEVVITNDVDVVGVLAQFGRGMIQDVSDQMFGKFSAAMRAQLVAAAGPATAPTPISAGPASPPAMTSAAATGPATPTAPTATVAPHTPAAAEALDLGALGTAAAGRAAVRMLRQPALWVAIAALAALLWFWLH